MAIEHRWDIVPVVIQDPTWEQSFPDVEGSSCRCAIPAAAACRPHDCGGRRSLRAEITTARARESLLETFRFVDIDPVVVTSSDPADILAEFLLWADLRRTRRVIGA